jgi:hypothetical protein
MSTKIIKSIFIVGVLAFANMSDANAQTHIYNLLQMHKSNSFAYSQAHATHYPAKLPTSQTAPAPLQFQIEINLKKPHSFDSLATDAKKNTITAGVSNGQLIWKDSSTGLSGSGEYSKMVDVALRDLLDKNTNIPANYHLSEIKVPKSKYNAVELNAVVMKPRQFGTSIDQIVVWMQSGKVIALEASYKDGSRLHAMIKLLKLEP